MGAPSELWGAAPGPSPSLGAEFGSRSNQVQECSVGQADVPVFLSLLNSIQSLECFI